MRSRNGAAGECVDFGQRGEESVFVEVGGFEREREVIAVAERLRGAIAEPGQLPHIGGDGGSDTLRRFPRGPAPGAVVARAEDLEDRVVVERFAVDRPTVPCEPRLDVALQLDCFAAEIGLDLVGHESLNQEIELTGDQRIAVALRLRGAQRCEDVGVGQRIGQCDIGGVALRLGLVAGVDVRVPPCRVRGRFERFEGRRARGDDVVRGHLNQVRW